MIQNSVARLSVRLINRLPEQLLDSPIFPPPLFLVGESPAARLVFITMKNALFKFRFPPFLVCLRVNLKSDPPENPQQSYLK